MRVVVFTPPQPIVSYEEAVARLLLDEDADEQADVEAMIASATAQLDGPDGWLGRCLGEQVLDAHYSAFDDPSQFALPCGPVLGIVSLSWLGADRQRRQATADDYDVVDNIVYAAGMPIWSGMLIREDALTIRYRAGYAEVPAPIRDAILLMVGNAYRNRDAAPDAGVDRAVTALLAPYRLFR